MNCSILLTSRLIFDEQKQRATKPCRPEVSDNVLRWLPRDVQKPWRTYYPLQKTIIVGQKPLEFVYVMEACLLPGVFP
jgi:hypothetical protein